MSHDLYFVQRLDTSLPVKLVLGDASTEPSLGASGRLVARVGLRSVALAGSTSPARTLPLSNQTSGAWQSAQGIVGGGVAAWSPAARNVPEALAPWAEATAAPVASSAPWRNSDRATVAASGSWREGRQFQADGRSTWADASPMPVVQLAAWAEATRGPSVAVAVGWQELTREALSHLASWGEAQRQAVGVTSPWHRGRPLNPSGIYPWDLGRLPDPGESEHPVKPPDPPRHVCYTPPLPGAAVVLEFRDPATVDDTRLEFICSGRPQSVVVPVRRVYIVQNSVSLIRVRDGAEIACLGASLALDVDSWTWGFSASLPASERPKLGRNEDLELWVNGVAYRVRAESLVRDRSFGQSALRVGGRGRAAVLAAPEAPVTAWANAAERTAQQIVGDVLPVGWTVDWRLTDWTIPAGAWSHQGSCIEAALDIVTAAGGYIQPHPTAQTLIARHRYPAAPWEWFSLAPDFVLPSAVVLQEGVEWLARPDYDRVYVSGTSMGVLGNIKRAGTAGLNLAPMVTHAALTAEPAVRQRGRAVLADTGPQAHVTLRLPVLAETGVILPGALVEYVDGGESMRGLVRSTSVDAGQVEVWQTVKVQTHV